MLMAQKNKPPKNKCSHHENKIQYIPIPIPQYPNHPHSHLNEDEGDDETSNVYGSSFKPFKKRKNKNKKYNFSKLRKFRVAVIAVYFYLLFPRYVNKFTRKRFKIHSEKYFSNSRFTEKLLLNEFSD